jgi:uncharacterized damage-inducible protein DinB
MPNAMINAAYVRTMAAYNSEMNRRLYEAAANLSDAERRKPTGAFWNTLHGTLCHILWGDHAWMARFAGWPKPTVGIKESAGMIADFADLRAARTRADAGIEAWAAGVDDAWLAQELTWFSGSVGRDVSAPRGFTVAHFFNHQTHHRGQAHLLLTAAGQATGDTDLFLVVKPRD